MEYRSIQVVFTDLDGTFFPGAHEEAPQDDRRGLLRTLHFSSNAHMRNKLDADFDPTSSGNIERATILQQVFSTSPGARKRPY